MKGGRPVTSGIRLALEDVVTAAYCALDDALRKALSCRAAANSSRGPAPTRRSFDREVLCLAVLQELLEFESYNTYHEWVEANAVMKSLFPRRLSRQTFADRQRRQRECGVSRRPPRAPRARHAAPVPRVLQHRGRGDALLLRHRLPSRGRMPAGEGREEDTSGGYGQNRLLRLAQAVLPRGARASGLHAAGKDRVPPAHAGEPPRRPGTLCSSGNDVLGDALRRQRVLAEEGEARGTPPARHRGRGREPVELEVPVPGDHESLAEDPPRSAATAALPQTTLSVASRDASDSSTGR